MKSPDFVSNDIDVSLDDYILTSMANTLAVVLALIISTAAVAQQREDVGKCPAAVPAADKRPQICSPEPIYTPSPKWLQGVLQVELIVGSHGKVCGVRTLQSTYSESDTQAALSVLKEWEFKPAYLRGSYVNSKLTVELQFRRSSMTIRFPNYGGCKYSAFPTM